MENIKDDYIIRSMMDTGYPPWAQEMVDGWEEDAGIQEEETLPESCTNVLSNITFGHDFARSRKFLADATGLTDRQVRKAIEILRRDYIILNDGDGYGYYRPVNDDKLLRYYRTEMARAISIMRRLRPVRRRLKFRGML